MHYAHVNYKEQTMNRYMLEEFHKAPALYRRLAEREQARAVGEAFAWLLGYVKARFAPGSGLRPGRWIERLG